MLFEDKEYTLNEIRQILREANEFKAKKGVGVDSAEKSQNKKAVDDIINDVKSFDGGLGKVDKTNKKKEDVTDFNKNPLDVHFEVEPSDSYKKRSRANALGFPSEENMKNSSMKENGGLDFSGNEKFYDSQREKAEMQSDEEEVRKESGLAARVKAKAEPDKYKPKTLYTESNNMKRLRFSNTVFLSESQMLSKVPENFRKTDGKFIMMDGKGTQYMVECKYDPTFNYGQLKVGGKKDENSLNEQFEAMRRLASYDSKAYQGYSVKKNEESEKQLSEAMENAKNAIIS